MTFLREVTKISITVALIFFTAALNACASNMAGYLTSAPIRREGAIYLRSCIYEDGQCCCAYSNNETHHAEVWCKPTMFGDWAFEGEIDEGAAE